MRLTRVRALKLLGLAGLAGVAATGAVLVRGERQRRACTPEDVRERLHARLAAADGPDGTAQAPASAAELAGGRRHLLARLLARGRHRA